jgi:hypothetical protein
MVPPAASLSTSAPVVKCPTCKAKRTRPDSTLCAYCATPFDLVAPVVRSEGGPSPYRERLERMEQQDGWENAQAWVPLESAEFRSHESRQTKGIYLIAAGAVTWVLVAFTLPWWGPLIPMAMILRGLRLSVASFRARRQILARPLLKRPAIVLDRRSTTKMGSWNGKTTYFFQLEFLDGSEGEFRWPGRGVDHAPLVTGATGLAFTRGDTLLGMRAIRV